MTVTTTSPAHLPVGLVHDTEVIATVLPVSTIAQANLKTLLRLITPAEPGDVLDITGRARVTSELTYACGVGHHLWAYDADDGLPYDQHVWFRIGEYNGDNVWKSPRHHMPLHISDVYTVPDAWPPGHRMCIIYRADAHSTAAVTGHHVTVDAGYGGLTVRRWHAPTVSEA